MLFRSRGRARRHDHRHERRDVPAADDRLPGDGGRCKSYSRRRVISSTREARVRQARLAESVTVLKGCFGADPFSFAGEHYTITDYDAQPKPVQQPHPPFFIGGGGRTTLELAAREAQTVGFAPRILRGGVPDPRSFTWAATEEKIGWVREAAGERFDELTLNVYPSFWPVTVTDDLDGEAGKVAAALLERSGIELTVPEVIDSPHIFIGSHDRFVEKFTELRDRLGISSFLIGDLDQLGPVVEQLAGT